MGNAGTYQVGNQQMTFTYPAHNGPTGAPLAPRALVTTVQYPLVPGSTSQPSGRRPATARRLPYRPWNQCSSPRARPSLQLDAGEAVLMGELPDGVIVTSLDRAGRVHPELVKRHLTSS